MLATDEATRDAPISQIKELLIVEGYDFESGPTRLDDRLMAACNSVQKKRLEKAWATRKEPLRLERMYKVPESLEQAHLLFSHDRQRILHSFKWILDALPDDAETIADVGCGTGSLSRLIAHYFPRASVLGVDIAKNLTEAAKAGAASENLRFETSDMANLSKFGTFDTIVSACGIEVPFFPEPTFEELIAHEGELILPQYRKSVLEAYSPMLTGVRKAASNKGRLIGVFRIPTLQQFRHFVDVAAECGWRLVTPIEHRISAGDEWFFSAVFSAIEPATLTS